MLNTIAEIDKIISKLEEYRRIVKWAGRNKNDPQWDKGTIESTIKMITESKKKLPTAKAEIKQFFKDLVVTF